MTWLYSVESQANVYSSGDIFFGKNFGCLEEGKAPSILHDLDQVFPAYWIEWQFPLLYRLLTCIPHKRLYHFLTAGERFYGVWHFYSP